MADIDVKKQSGAQPLEKPRETGTGRRESRSLFSLSPVELFTRSPFALMRRLTDDMDRMFEGFGGGLESGTWSPAVEVFERDSTLEVVAELPGLKENEIKVEITDDGLVIEGERKRGREERREGFYRSERSYGQFYRMIPLPEGANTDQAHAEFRNGELRVSVPIPERHRHVREIPIGNGERRQAGTQTQGRDQTAKAS